MKNRLPPTFAKHLKTRSLAAAQPTPRPFSDDDLLRLALLRQQEGRRREAEQLCINVLTRNPGNAQALYQAATLALDARDLGLAIDYLRRAIKAKPTDAFFHVVLAETYENKDQLEAAQRHFRQALVLKPSSVEALCGEGRLNARAGNAELGLSFFERAYGIDRNHRLVRVGLAQALMSLGRMEDAIKHLEAAIARRHHVGWAWHSLVSAREFSGEPQELRRLGEELSNPSLPRSEAIWVHYAIGKILNDLKRYDEAVDHFQEAKTMAGRGFNLEASRSYYDSIIRTFSPELLGSKTEPNESSEVPVFIVGMPRSGTTLVEQICASHPSVHGAGELPTLGRLGQMAGLTRGSPDPFSKLLTAVNSEQLSRMATAYLVDLRKNAPEALRITDKMPSNFELIGFIALLFPNARIIHCRRDAIDTCVSCFMTNFDVRHGYNADLTNLGLYYREYNRLMRHWNTVLPGRIYECSYETLVADQEAESRRLIEFLGLPWDSACLQFYETDRTVFTASNWQVRQPVYTSSVKRWKNYEHKIQPLIEALGDLAEI
ncbi:sulfotransferase [Mesorhizobium sp. KR9-304]|uniref:sulfotransferase n=1 Tax=Mesorhizobium sp. KR9-304 TaxID=3156614 RepID=UPI0032B31A61